MSNYRELNVDSLNNGRYYSLTKRHHHESNFARACLAKSKFYLHLKNGMVESSSARGVPYNNFHARSYFSGNVLTAPKVRLQFEPIIGM